MGRAPELGVHGAEGLCAAARKGSDGEGECDLYALSPFLTSG